jgi:SAM-dependent methyltransferase
MGMYIVIFLSFLLGAAFTAFAVTLFASTYFAQKSAAPFFPTPKNAVRDALREAALAPGELFYDLGAGTGKALLIAEKEFGARAVGFEISVIFYSIGKINLFINRSRAKFLAKNLFTQNIGDADVVFCFLFPPVMQKLENKLKAELKPGARVIVYAFPLPTITPTKITTVHGKWKMFFYEISVS